MKAIFKRSWYFFELGVLAFLAIGILILKPTFTYTEDLTQQMKPHLGASISDTLGLKEIIAGPHAATPGAWPIGGTRRLVPGIGYEFVVVGHSTCEAKLIAADQQGNPIVWPGPPLTEELDTAIISLEAKPFYQAVTFGILIQNPTAEAHVSISSITLRSKNKYNLTKAFVALLMLMALVTAFFCFKDDKTITLKIR